MNAEELQSELLSLRRSQFDFRIKKASGALEKTHPLNQLRKNIARVKTLMTQKAGTSDVK